MADICNDNRFELIEKYKLMLIEGTNIKTSEDEMKVLDDILYRLWQMGWLDKLEQPTIKERKKGEWTEKEVIYKDEAAKVIEEWQSAKCSNCGLYHTTPYLYSFFHYNYCPHCGAPMEGKQE